MVKYIEQPVFFDDIKHAENFDLYDTFSIPDSQMMKFATVCEKYGHFITIPLMGCEDFAISNNGVLFNNRNHRLITPRVTFNEYGNPDMAEIYLSPRGQCYDIGELVAYCRFRLNPQNVRVKYTLKTDGTAIFLDTLTFIFREPEKIFIPEDLGIEAKLFFGKHFVSRLNSLKWFVSKEGSIYDAKNQEFISICTQKVYSKADRSNVLQATIYPFHSPVPLLEYTLAEWSGIVLPKGYNAVNTSGIITKVDLDYFAIRDFRQRNVSPTTHYNIRLLDQRAQKLKDLRKRIDDGIACTTSIIAKYEPR